jgi:GDP-mannose 6-dehydrogenase
VKISVFGLGYVGCVTSACLAEAGHHVWGVDVSSDKVETLKAGRSPIVENRIDTLIAEARRGGRLDATVHPREAVLATELSLICVGTPSNGHRGPDLTALHAVSRQIGEALREKPAPHTVVFRSTVMPGTIRQALIPVLEVASGRRPHRDFDVCVNPEFLRESTAVADFYEPPFVVIGEQTSAAGDLVARMYDAVKAPVVRTTYEVAELLKYACNAFHALKIAFANEIGALCKSTGTDARQVMQLFAMDDKLNISPAYLKPGFAFGGSCLPKDLRALLYKARQVDLALPLLSSVLESNRLHLERALQRILDSGAKRVGVVGLSFKTGTDDLRESPSVALIETLVGKGFQLKIYDPDVLLSRLVGANKRYIETEIPHLSSLLCPDLDDVVGESEVIVVSKPTPGVQAALARHPSRKLVLDFVGIPWEDRPTDHIYEGICW